MAKGTCSVAGCGEPAKGRGWCGLHYARWRKHRDPLWEPFGGRDKCCSVEGCERPYKARGYCETHYHAWRNHNDPLWTRPTMPPCAVEGCEQKYHASGYCEKHYRLWRSTGVADRQPRRPKTVLERWLAKVDVRGPDECWPWTGAVNENGYGQLAVRCSDGKYRPRRAHRVGYGLFRGTVPPHLFVLHGCDNPICCNPWHGRLGTKADNARDMADRGRGNRGKKFPRKTRCIRDHPLTDENAYITKDGYRHCRLCVNERARRKRAEKRSAKSTPPELGSSDPPRLFPL